MTAVAVAKPEEVLATVDRAGLQDMKPLVQDTEDVSWRYDRDCTQQHCRSDLRGLPNRGIFISPLVRAVLVVHAGTPYACRAHPSFCRVLAQRSTFGSRLHACRGASCSR